MSELGVGWISIRPEVSEISPGIARALNGLDPVAERSGKSMGGKISSGIGLALKATAAGVGASAGGLIAMSISKGLGRLTSIDDAQAKLRGLGHDTQSTAVIMDSALASVRGTAYGLGDAASLAAGAVAAGIKPGQDLTKYLTMTADAAAIAGADLSEMGSIINQVQTGQVAYTDNLNQLADRGVPIYSWLAEEAGVALGDVKKLASEGKISSEMFFAAIEKNIGGAAQEMGNSVSGAASNFTAALGRIGATTLTPFFDLAVDGFGSATAGVDALEARIAPLAASMSTWLQGTAVPGLIDFKNSSAEAFDSFRNTPEVQSLLAQTGIVIRDVVSSGRELAPVMVEAGSALAQASAALGIGSWQLALVGLEGFGAAAKLATPPLELLTGLMNDHPSLVVAAVAAYTGFKTIPGILDKINPVVSKITDGAASGFSSVKLFGESFSEAQGYIMKANPELSKASAAMRVLGGEGGVAAAGLGTLKSAASGVMGLFGGPWGVALAAAGAVVTGVVQANQRAEAAQEAMAAAARDSASAQTELTSAVAGTTGVLDDQAMAAAARVAKNELAELIEVGGSLQGVFFNIETSAERGTLAWQQEMQAGYELRDSYAALEEASENLGIPMESLHEVVAAGGPEYQSLIEHLRETGGASDIAADQLEGARENIERMIRDARDLDPAVAQAAAGIEQMANAAGDADSKLSALNSIMQAMGLAPKDAEQAMRDASEAINDVVEKAGSLADVNGVLGEALIGVNGEIDTTTSNGQALFDQLDGLGQELANVAANGGDTEGKFAEMQSAIQVLADDFGLTTERVLELGRGFRLVPRELEVAVALEGADGTLQDIGEVWSALEQLPTGQQLQMNAMTDEAIAALEAVGVQVEEIPNSDNVLISAETEEAQSQLADLILMMDDLGELEVSPEILLNTDRLVGSANDATHILNSLNVLDPSPHADLIIDKLLNGVDISQGELDYLAAQSSSPVADLEKKLLEAGIKISNELLDELHKKPTKPIIDADSQPAIDAANKAREELDKLPKEVITKLRIQEWREYYSSGDNVAYGQQYDRRADGGRIPAYADGARHQGYQLPAFGPGTEVTDGFLAVDYRGEPIARLDKNEWVINGRSSEKYNPLLNAINRDDPSRIKAALSTIPGLVNGGVVESITGIVKKEFPEMQITSTHRPGHAGYHGRNLAVDFSNGTDTTPEMAKAAEYFHKKYGGELAQLIHFGPWNIGAGEPVGDGNDFYGAGTMAEHRNHVHIAAEQPLTGTGGGSWSVSPAGIGEMSTRQTKSMSWSSAPKISADFGAASDYHSMSTRYLRVGDRHDVELGVTKTSSSYSTAPGAYPRISGGGSGDYVEAIAANALDHGLPERGAMIGVGTAFVEAGNPIQMWANRAVPASLEFPHDAVGSDHDSVGIFQQRDNGAWGTLAQRMDAYQSAGLFFDAMLSKFPNWQSMDPGAVAQGVQVSAFPDRYAKQMDAALDAVRATSLYDQGGWLMPGSFGFNATNTPEPVFNAAQWPVLKGILQIVPPMVHQMEALVPALYTVATANKAEVRAGATSGSATTLLDAARNATRWFDETELVMDAERGLAQVREQAAHDVESLESAEKALVEAQENLAHAQSSEAELSTSMQRRLADAEKDLAEARGESIEDTTAQTRKIADAEKAVAKARESGDASEIADAEEKLSRAREDVAESTAKSTAKQAERIADAELKLARLREDAQEELAKSADKRSEEAAQAAKDLETAEKNLANARKNVESSAARIEAAERTVAAARISAVGDLVSSVTGSLAGMAAAVAAFTTDMARMASMVEATQQAVSSEQQALARHNIAVIQAQNAYRIAEWDTLMARQKGLEDLNLSESALSNSRNETMKIGSTSVSALSQAVDRFRTSGVWAASSWISSAANMSAATAGYSAQAEQELVAMEERKAAALAASELAQLEALHRQEMAGLAVVEATMLQLQSAEVLRLHTEHLKEQTEALYGMNSNQAKGGTSFLEGLVGIFTGGGGLLDGIMKAVAGFAAGGPVGAAPGVIQALASLPSLITGFTKVTENFGVAREAWDQMDWKAKILTVLGLGGAAASATAGVVGSVNGGGPEALTTGLEVAEQFAKTTMESITGSMDARMEAAERRHEERMREAEARHDRENADFQLDAAEQAARRELELAEAKANKEWFDLQVKIAETNHAETQEILESQLAVAEAQRDDMRELLAEFQKREPVDLTLVGDAFTAEQVEQLLTQNIGKQLDLEIRVTKLESGQSATASQYESAKR